jgi:hypothetical protein
LLEKVEPPEMVRIELDIDIAPPVPAVLLEKLELPEMVRYELDIDIAPPEAAEFLVKVRFEPVKDTVEPKA